jgi:dienelactone hydrolase
MALRIATDPIALVNIPVEDPKTRSVSAALYQPPGTGPFPAVVIMSGCAGVNTDADVVGRANFDYMSHGVVTLVIDSFTPRGLTEVCSDTKLLFESVAFRARDAYAAIGWLSGMPEVDQKRIFLQGYSHGAVTAIAAIDGRRPQSNVAKIAGVIAYYPYCSANSKFSVPTIILIGEKDDWTPANLCTDIVDKTNAEITVYSGAFHIGVHANGHGGVLRVLPGRLARARLSRGRDVVVEALSSVHRQSNDSKGSGCRPSMTSRLTAPTHA